jgi:ligand-binding SRPBCC domain-containing protein
LRNYWPPRNARGPGFRGTLTTGRSKVTHSRRHTYQEVTWAARHFGVPLRMTSRITALDFPESFMDEQIRGPFKSFRHVHEFEATATGSIMTDRVEFTAPFGILGRLMEDLVLRRYLQRLITNRGRFVAGLEE